VQTAKNLLSDVGFYAQRLRHMKFSGPVVLCYHGIREDDAKTGAMPYEPLHVTNAEFRSHCELVRDSCDPISAEEYLSHLLKGTALPPRPVLITFDDGYRSVLRLGVPALRDYRLPATVFLCTAPTRDRSLYWFDGVCRERGEAEVERLKQIDYADWKKLVAPFGVRAEQADCCAPMSPEEVRVLAQEPGIEVGAHTDSHPILAKATRAEQAAEILKSNEWVEKWTGKRARTFAYPNGKPGADYTSETVQLLEETGFAAAFTTTPGFAANARRFEIPRFLMLSGISKAELAHRLCFSWQRG
jgi:peptidoglycan/xylan/chitin deacetylase (PgdA/CDA1 family)